MCVQVCVHTHIHVLQCTKVHKQLMALTTHIHAYSYEESYVYKY
jgi:hypothetical protein